MNLGQLKTRIANKLSFFSENAEHQNDITNVVNDELTALYDMERWPFLTVESSLRLLADIVKVEIDFDSDGLIADNWSEWSADDFDGLVLRTGDELDSARRYGRIAGPFPLHWQQVVNRSRDDYSYDQGGFPDPDNVPRYGTTAFLDHPPSTTPVGTITDVIIRHDRYQMPYDCSEIIAIYSRDDRQGNIPLQNRTGERGFMSGSDAPGKPQCWVLDDPVDAGEAPALVPTCAASSGGTLAAGDYRYFYAYWYRGCYSGTSDIIEVTTTANQQVTFANMEASHLDRYGRYKHVFREDVTTRPGRFYYVGAVADEDTQFVDDGTPAPDRLYAWDDRYTTPHKTVRFWPRPATDQWVSVQYLSIPRRLVHDNDVPALPEQFHPYIIHRVVAEFAQRAGNAERQESELALADEVFKRLKAKEVLTYETRTRRPWSPRSQRGTVPRNPITFSG